MEHYERLAMEIFFNGITEKKLLEKGWKYKNNKSFIHVKEAIKKGKSIKYGMGKFEKEIYSCAKFLSKVIEKKEEY